MEGLERLIASLERPVRPGAHPRLQTDPDFLAQRESERSVAAALRAASSDREDVLHILLDAMEKPERQFGFSDSASYILKREAVGNEMVISRCLQWLQRPGNWSLLHQASFLLSEIAIGHPGVIRQCLRELELRRDNDIVHQSAYILRMIAIGNEDVIRHCLGFLPGKPEDSHFVAQVAMSYVESGSSARR